MKIERTKHLFQEILNSIDEIENFNFLIKERNDEKYDKMGFRAMEREIKFISAQWERIREMDTEFNIPAINNLLRLDRMLKSAYIRISPKLLSSFVENEIPILKTEIEELLYGED
ncbi:MAG: hypothetical protein R3C61_22275 [Bacteroidia bacterium]